MQITIKNQRLLRLLGFTPAGDCPAIVSMPLYLWIVVVRERIAIWWRS